MTSENLDKKWKLSDTDFMTSLHDMNVPDDDHQRRVESHNRDTAYDSDEISEDNTYEFLVDSDEDAHNTDDDKSEY